MFTEILKVIPKLDDSATSSMVRNLSSRFAKVAKSFGGGVLSALKGGGYVAIATALIDKVLNPLEHVQSVIDKTLNKGSDLAVFAKQFDTTAGKLARLQALGESAGLDPEGVRLLLLKFQGAVSKSALSGDPSAVSNFVGRKDTADAFFDFIQNMQKMNSTQRSLVQQEVFGERQIGRASEFLNQDFAKVNRQLGGPSADDITAAAKSLEAQQSYLQLKNAQRGLKEINDQAVKITPHAIQSIAKRQDVASESDLKNLSNFDRLERLQIAADKIVNQLELGVGKIAPLLAPALEAIPGILQKLDVAATAVQKSRAVRGLLPGQGKDK